MKYILNKSLSNKCLFGILLSTLTIISIIYYLICFAIKKELYFTNADSFILGMQAIQFLIVCFMLIWMIFDRQKYYGVLKEIWDVMEDNHDEILCVNRETQIMITKLFKKCGDNNEKK